MKEGRYEMVGLSNRPDQSKENRKSKQLPGSRESNVAVDRRSERREYSETQGRKTLPKKSNETRTHHTPTHPLPLAPETDSHWNIATILSRRGDPGSREFLGRGSPYPPPSLSCKHGGRREAFGRGSVWAGAGIIAGVGVVILVLGVIVRVVLGVVIAVVVVVVVVLASILVPAPACAFASVPIPVEVKLEEPAAVTDLPRVLKLERIGEIEALSTVSLRRGRDVVRASIHRSCGIRSFHQETWRNFPSGKQEWLDAIVTGDLE
ncbi:hypothetical protein DFP72DRAFT_855279 [Ephemerocybe angulata]|uniref:Uncharacterized protein n=1 Tax=Ephemerocybe angulata TaxID=980116 RepID=A0A8H6HHT7_9AGAR|nr:hypothetical protein DFP72DRAFT_855279 [Tulosesus angulatus]